MSTYNQGYKDGAAAVRATVRAKCSEVAGAEWSEPYRRVVASLLAVVEEASHATRTYVPPSAPPSEVERRKCGECGGDEWHDLGDGWAGCPCGAQFRWATVERGTGREGTNG